MFDRTALVIGMSSPTKTVNSNVRVQEHRAPTDASVALLKDMEEKADQKLITSYYASLKNNKIEGAVFTYQQSPLDLKLYYRAGVRVNGSVIEVKGDIEPDYETAPERLLMEALHKAVMQELEKVVMPTLTFSKRGLA